MSEDVVLVEHPDDWNAVSERLGGMEDGNVRRFRFENSDDIDPVARTLAFGPPEKRELRIEVQAQFDEFEWVELRFSGVRELRFRTEWDAPMKWRAEKNGWHVEFLTVEVTADHCEVTVH